MDNLFICPQTLAIVEVLVDRGLEVEYVFSPLSTRITEPKHVFYSMFEKLKRTKPNDTLVGNLSKQKFIVTAVDRTNQTVTMAAVGAGSLHDISFKDLHVDYTVESDWRSNFPVGSKGSTPSGDEYLVVRHLISNLTGEPLIETTYSQSGWTGRFTEQDADRFLTPYVGQVKLTNPQLGGECRHEMRQYVGLLETYSYCVKCDHKEDQC